MVSVHLFCFRIAAVFYMPIFPFAIVFLSFLSLLFCVQIVHFAVVFLLSEFPFCSCFDIAGGF